MAPGTADLCRSPTVESITIGAIAVTVGAVAVVEGPTMAALVTGVIMGEGSMIGIHLGVSGVGTLMAGRRRHSTAATHGHSSGRLHLQLLRLHSSGPHHRSDHL